MTDDTHRQEELSRVARAAAQHAAELVNTAAIAAHQLTAAAASAAKAQAEATSNDMRHMQKDVQEIKEMLNSKFVTVEAFTPVKSLVFGLVALMLSSVVIALIALVVTKP
jgi:uncharacterized protein (DUF2147 family)